MHPVTPVTDAKRVQSQSVERLRQAVAEFAPEARNRSPPQPVNTVAIAVYTASKFLDSRGRGDASWQAWSLFSFAKTRAKRKL